MPQSETPFILIIIGNRYCGAIQSRWMMTHNIIRPTSLGSNPFWVADGALWWRSLNSYSTEVGPGLVWYLEGLLFLVTSLFFWFSRHDYTAFTLEISSLDVPAIPSFQIRSWRSEVLWWFPNTQELSKGVCVLLFRDRSRQTDVSFSFTCSHFYLN